MGTSGMSFGGGFASGLASVLAQKRQQDQQAKERQIGNLWKGIGFLVDSGQVNDITDLQPHFDALAQLGAFGNPKQKPKAGQLDPQAHTANILGHIIRQSNGQPAHAASMGPLVPTQAAVEPAPFPAGPDDAGNLLPSNAIESRNDIPAPGTKSPVSPATHRLMGIPLLTPEQASQRALDQQTTKTLQQVQLVRDRIYPALKAVDPSATLEDAFAVAGVKLPTDRQVAFQRVAGEVNGQRVYGVFNPRLGQYEDADTHQPLTGFTPLSSTASTNLGTDREAIAREKYGKRAADLNPEQLADVNAEVQKRAVEKAGSVTTARSEAAAKSPLNSNQRFQALRDLQGDWRKADAPEKETKRQFDIMQTGLRRFSEGDKIGGSQAVLVTFQKILDPNSVVRESEYDRSPEGLGLKQRMQGYLERLSSGGAGVPLEELQQMVETAKQFVQGMADYNALERNRISEAAKEAGLDPARVFGVAAVPLDRTGAATPAPAAAPAVKKVDGKWVIQTPTAP